MIAISSGVAWHSSIRTSNSWRRIEAQIIPRELGKTLALMVGFRNILVHDYAKLDTSVVLKVLRKDLADLERFRDAVGPII